EVGGIKLEHDFIGDVDVSYFGIIEQEEFTERITQVFNILFSKNLGACFSGDNYFIDGTKNSFRGVMVPDNFRIITSLQTKFSIIPNSATNYAAFTFRYTDNGYINRIHIVGDREEHLGTTGEWGMGLNFLSAKNIII